MHELVHDEFNLLRYIGPCHAGCPCPRFVAAPLKPGLYIPLIYSRLDFEGLEVVRWDPKGIERRCVMCEDRLTGFDGRYAIRLFPNPDDEDDGLEEVYEDEPDWAADLDAANPLAFVSAIACESCVLNAAGLAA